MKKHFRISGFIFLILGFISIILLFTNGSEFYEIEASYIFPLLVFTAILFPAIGSRFIKKK